VVAYYGRKFSVGTVRFQFSSRQWK